MVLIPYQMLSQFTNQQNLLHPEEAQLSTLDHSLNSILGNRGHNPELKTKLYGQALNRFLTQKNELRPQEQSYDSDLPQDDDLILAGMPKRFQQRAKGLLAHVKRNPLLRWTPQGELIYRGNVINGSNITDLVHEYARTTPRMHQPLGMAEFDQALRDNHTPNEFMRQAINRPRPIIPVVGAVAARQQQQQQPESSDDDSGDPNPAAVARAYDNINRNRRQWAAAAARPARVHNPPNRWSPYEAPRKKRK